MVTPDEARAELGLLVADEDELFAAHLAEAEGFQSDDAVPGSRLTVEQARAMTESIREKVTSVRYDLYRLDVLRGWKALGYTSFRQWALTEFEFEVRRFYQELQAARIESIVCTDVHIGSTPEAHLRPLAALKEPDDWRAVWKEVQARSETQKITGDLVAEEVKNYRELQQRDELLLTVQEPGKAKRGTAKLNRTNENVDWAWWTWNPVTGCLHDCPYCYARDIANRFYPQGFKPTFHEDRLGAPGNTPVPTDTEALADPRSRRIFTCSMADLFGKWVPQEWIDAVFEEIRGNPQWTFLCLTKFPQRLAEIEWPENAWVGTTVDKQYRVPIAEKAFRGVKAGIKWLSCEPLLEPLKFSSLEMFDWVVIGGASKSTQTEASWPNFEWVVDLYNQARAAGCKVYIKPNTFSSETKAPKEEP